MRLLIPIARRALFLKKPIQTVNLQGRFNTRTNFRFLSTIEGIAAVEDLNDDFDAAAVDQTPIDPTATTDTFDPEKYANTKNLKSSETKTVQSLKSIDSKKSELGDISHLKDKPEETPNTDGPTGYFQNPYEEQIEEATMSASDEFVFELTKIYDNIQNKFHKAASHEGLANQIAEMRGISPEMNRDDLRDEVVAKNIAYARTLLIYGIITGKVRLHSKTTAGAGRLTETTAYTTSRHDQLTMRIIKACVKRINLEWLMEEQDGEESGVQYIYESLYSPEISFGINFEVIKTIKLIEHTLHKIDFNHNVLQEFERGFWMKEDDVDDEFRRFNMVTRPGIDGDVANIYTIESQHKENWTPFDGIKPKMSFTRHTGINLQELGERGLLIDQCINLIQIWGHHGANESYQRLDRDLQHEMLDRVMQELNRGNCNFLFGDNPMLMHMHEIVSKEFDEKSKLYELKEEELEKTLTEKYLTPFDTPQVAKRNQQIIKKELKAELDDSAREVRRLHTDKNRLKKVLEGFRVNQRNTEIKGFVRFRHNCMIYEVLNWLFNFRGHANNSAVMNFDDRDTVLTEVYHADTSGGLGKNAKRYFKKVGPIPKLTDEHHTYDQFQQLFITRNGQIHPRVHPNKGSLVGVNRPYPIQALCYGLDISLNDFYVDCHPDDRSYHDTTYRELLRSLYIVIFGEGEEKELAKQAMISKITIIQNISFRSDKSVRKAENLKDRAAAATERFYNGLEMVGFHYPTLEFAEQLSAKNKLRWRNYKLEQLSPLNLHKFDSAIEEIFPGGVNTSGIMVTHEERFMIKLQSIMNDFKKLSPEELAHYDQKLYKSRIKYCNVGERGTSWRELRNTNVSKKLPNKDFKLRNFTSAVSQHKTMFGSPEAGSTDHVLEFDPHSQFDSDTFGGGDEFSSFGVDGDDFGSNLEEYSYDGGSDDDLLDFDDDMFGDDGDDLDSFLGKEVGDDPFSAFDSEATEEEGVDVNDIISGLKKKREQEPPIDLN